MISIVIPTHNRAHLITETIQSVINQTYKDIEIIIIDSSEDNTYDVIYGIIGSNPDTKIHYEKVDYCHLNKKRKYGMSLAKGEYGIFSDDDDILYPTYCETLLPILKSSGFAFIYCPFDINFEMQIDLKEEDIYNRKPFNLESFKEKPQIHTTFLFKKDIYDLIGGCDETLLHYTDIDLAANFISKGYYPVFYSKPLYCYRVHKNQRCNIHDSDERQQALEYVRKKYKGFLKI
jgi:glycosyltransferase involved in cell wall biosynthesis